MKRQIIRLTESDLHNIIKNTVRDLIRENDFDERHVLKLAHKDDDMESDLPPFGGDDAMTPPPPPMGDNDPMGASPMGDSAPQDNEDPMSDDNTPNSPIGGSPDDENDPMGNDSPMDENEPTDANMGGNSNTQEIDDIFNNLGIEDQSAVLKYAKSMSDNSSPSNNDNNMPMESFNRRLDRIIKEVFDAERGKDRTCKREIKDISQDIPMNNIWRTHR